MLQVPVHTSWAKAVLCAGLVVLAGFAIVKLATERNTGEQYAVKIMTLPPVGVEPGDNESTRWVLMQISLMQVNLPWTSSFIYITDPGKSG